MNGVDKPDISPEAKEQAEKFKAEANELYKSKFLHLISSHF